MKNLRVLSFPMKKVLLTCLAMCLTMMALADDFSLRGERKVTLCVDWSEATIVGFTSKNINTYEPDWDKDQNVLLMKMVLTFNKHLGAALPAVKEGDTNYTIELRPIFVSDRGDMTCYAVIKDRQGNVVETFPNFKAEGGHCGSFLNLVGDGMKSSGKQLAKRVKKLL